MITEGGRHFNLAQQFKLEESQNQWLQRGGKSSRKNGTQGSNVLKPNAIFQEITTGIKDANRPGNRRLCISRLEKGTN